MEAEKCKINASADLVPGEALPGSQVSIFSLCPHRVEGMREQSGTSYIKALILFMRALSLRHNHLLNALPPNTITMGVRFQHTNLGKGVEHKHLIYSNVSKQVKMMITKCNMRTLFGSLYEQTNCWTIF